MNLLFIAIIVAAIVVVIVVAVSVTVLTRNDSGHGSDGPTDEAERAGPFAGARNVIDGSVGMYLVRRLTGRPTDIEPKPAPPASDRSAGETGAAAAAGLAAATAFAGSRRRQICRCGGAGGTSCRAGERGQRCAPGLRDSAQPAMAGVASPMTAAAPTATPAMSAAASPMTAAAGIAATPHGAVHPRSAGALKPAAAIASTQKVATSPATARPARRFATGPSEPPAPTSSVTAASRSRSLRPSSSSWSVSGRMVEDRSDPRRRQSSAVPSESSPDAPLTASPRPSPRATPSPATTALPTASPVTDRDANRHRRQ